MIKNVSFHYIQKKEFRTKKKIVAEFGNREMFLPKRHLTIILAQKL